MCVATAVLSVVALACAGTGPPAATLHNPRPLNVSYDARSLILNGERRLFVSGGVHYARHQPALWAPVLRQAREAGLNGVTSYVMWDQHENVRGQYDWGQVQARSNITRFLQAAHDEGLLVHLRLGPYVDGEWSYGGYPWWINQVANITSGDNGAFRVEMQRWIGALVERVRPFLASNGGPVIMMQIENEFSDGSPEGVQYAEWALHMADALDTGVPWTFCNNSGSPPLALPPNTISTANAGMGPSAWMKEGLCGGGGGGTGGAHPHPYPYPGQPCLWTEIEEPFYQWNQRGDGGRVAGGLAAMQLQWYALGGAGSNYYMWAGGTDYGLSAGDDDTTSYHQYSCLEPVFEVLKTWSTLESAFKINCASSAEIFFSLAPSVPWNFATSWSKSFQTWTCPRRSSFPTPTWMTSLRFYKTIFRRIRRLRKHPRRFLSCPPAHVRTSGRLYKHCVKTTRLSTSLTPVPNAFARSYRWTFENLPRTMTRLVPPPPCANT